MTSTIDTLMELADKYASQWSSSYEYPTTTREDLRTALTEALVKSTGCISNCDACTFHHQSPAQAGYCYMFYEEPQGVCGQWKDANPNISEYPAKDISAQPVREPLPDDDISEIWDSWLINITDKISAIQFAREIESAHGIGGDK